MTQREYKEYRALSQSTLKTLNRDPKSFYQYVERWLVGELEHMPEFRPTESMKLGSLVDVLTLSPDEFSQGFVVNTAKSPTGQMLSFTDEYVRLERQSTSNYSSQIDKDTVQQLARQAYEYVGFKKDSFAKVMERFKDEALNYYSVYRTAGERTIVTAEMFTEAQKCVNALRAHRFANQYLVVDSGATNVDMHTQLAITDKYYIARGVEPIEVKCLIDRVIVNHVDKTIQPLDLKTTSDDSFQSSIISYRYDMQAAFYMYLLSIWAFNKGLSEYKILSFKFITVNTTNYGVDIWEMSDHDLEIGMYGGMTHYGRTVAGYYSLLMDYAWHKETNQWEYSKEMYTQGKRITNCFLRNDD